MTPYKKGDIILVPFPFSDQTFSKKRPAVVISSDVLYLPSYETIIITIFLYIISISMIKIGKIMIILKDNV